MISKLIDKLQVLWARRSSETYCNYLRNKGVKIGSNTYIYSRNALIDISRPSLVEIGSNCFMNQHFTLLTHDYVAKVFLGKGMDFMNSSGRVIIGDNVSFGQNVMVLKGVTIGNDCFIGAGSIVTKDIPSGSVAVGAPCKVLMTIDEYFRKRLDRCESEAFEYVRSIKERYGRLPRVDEMKEEFIFFVSGSEIDNYPMIPIKEQLGPMYENYRQHHLAKYGSFEEFLTAAGVI